MKAVKANEGSKLFRRRALISDQRSIIRRNVLFDREKFALIRLGRTPIDVNILGQCHPLLQAGFY